MRLDLPARSRPARWWWKISPSGAFDERALFHLLNLAREEDAFRSAHRAHARRPLADRGCPISPRGCAPCRSCACRAPDDALLRAVIVKLFADRQLAVDESLVGYLATRIERSFAGARAAVERSTGRRCGCKRPVNRALAAELSRDDTVNGLRAMTEPVVMALS